MNTKVDQFFEKINQLKEEMILLRKIISEHKELTEDFKWMHPCYTLNGKNVALIHGFKEYCAILFLKGALLKDPHGLLIQQTENVQSARQIRFTGINEIKKQKSFIKDYINEAIRVEKAGKKVVLKEAAEYPVPPEFESRLKQDAKLKKAFHALTPGRQKAYLFYFAQAKQSATRESRIEKYVSQIMNGKGLND